MEDQKLVEMTAEQIQEARQAEADKLRVKMNEDFDSLFEKLSSEKYDSQGYKKDAKLEIDGSTFSFFINVNSENKRIMDAVQKNLVTAFHTIDALLTENAKLSIELMKLHIQNIDAGKTTHNTELLEKTEQDGK